MNKMRILHNARVMQSCADGKLFIDQGDGTLHEVGGGITELPEHLQFGEVKTQLIFEVPYKEATSQNDGKMTWWLNRDDKKIKKTDTLIIEIRGDVFELKSYYYDGYYNWQIWGTYDIYDQPVENPYPFAFYMAADDYVWDEEGFYIGEALCFGYREEVYPGLDFDTEVRIYRKDVKPISPEYLPEYLQFGETYIPVDADFEYYGIREYNDVKVLRCWDVYLHDGVFIDPSKTYAFEINGEIIGHSNGFGVYDTYDDSMVTGNPYWLDFNENYDNKLPFVFGSTNADYNPDGTCAGREWGLNVDITLFPEAENLKVRVLELDVKPVDPKYLPSSVVTGTIQWPEEGVVEYAPIINIDKTAAEITGMLKAGTLLFFRDHNEDSDNYYPILYSLFQSETEFECGFRVINTQNGLDSYDVWLWTDGGSVEGEVGYRNIADNILPDMDNIMLTSPNGNQFKLTVSDDGTLSAKEMTVG